jgi:23S rRNA (cytosine1962-C5)-methyltransferase
MDVASFAQRISPPSDRRIAVRVTPDAERHIRGGHPWVFESSVLSASPSGAPGDVAIIFDKNRKFLALGLYDPNSTIRVRVMHRSQGEPLDEAFWSRRIAQALKVRSALVSDERTSAYRVVNGENDGLGSLVIDRYGDQVVMKIYSEALIAHLPSIVTALGSVIRNRAVVLRFARRVAPAAERLGLGNGMIISEHSDLDPVVEYLENGLKFEADLVHGPKTGAFLDQRENRALVRRISKSRAVLDVFSSSGGFTVHAAAGGAVSVHSVDISPHAIDAVKANIDRNRELPTVSTCRFSYQCDDAFAALDGLNQRRKRFDLVVVDPPSFAQKQRNVGAALAAYERLVELAAPLVNPGGLLMQASCSSRVTVGEFHAAIDQGLDRAGVIGELYCDTAHALDHPVGFPEGAYLKARTLIIRDPARPRKGAR